MIFVTVGSQKSQFNRLLIEIDKLIEDKKITEEVFAQIGYSDYHPRNYKFKEFLDRDEFAMLMNKCDTVITHGGTGAIVGAIKKGKKVIAIPRLKEFKEHVDNHQLQIIDQFERMKFILACYDILNLKKLLIEAEKHTYKKYESNTKEIIESIDRYIYSM